MSHGDSAAFLTRPHTKSSVTKKRVRAEDTRHTYAAPQLKHHGAREFTHSLTHGASSVTVQHDTHKAPKPRLCACAATTVSCCSCSSPAAGLLAWLSSCGCLAVLRIVPLRRGLAQLRACVSGARHKTACGLVGVGLTRHAGHLARILRGRRVLSGTHT